MYNEKRSIRKKCLFLVISKSNFYLIHLVNVYTLQIEHKCLHKLNNIDDRLLTSRENY